MEEERWGHSSPEVLDQQISFSGRCTSLHPLLLPRAPLLISSSRPPQLPGVQDSGVRPLGASQSDLLIGCRCVLGLRGVSGFLEAVETQSGSGGSISLFHRWTASRGRVVAEGDRVGAATESDFFVRRCDVS